MHECTNALHGSNPVYEMREAQSREHATLDGSQIFWVDILIYVLPLPSGILIPGKI